MAQGFITNTTAPTSLSTSAFTAVLLAEQTSGSPSDANSKAMPSGCSISHLDLVFTSAGSGTEDTVTCYLTWDSTGNDPLTATATAVELTTGGTSTVRHTTVALGDFFCRAPATQTTAGKVYLWVKPSMSSSTLGQARLNWHDSQG